MPWDNLRVTRDDDVVTVTIDRPTRRNALHGPLWDALGELGRDLAARRPRAVILRGEGDHFCAGMDLRPDNPLVQELGPKVATRDRKACAAIIERLKASLDAFATLPCPVLAAIEGACLGGGLELALVADLRVAGQSARFSMPETRWGLVPDVGGTVRLTRLIGRARAGDLILTGREARAPEALAWGLVNRVVPDGTAQDAADTMARTIARAAPRATSEALRVLRSVDGLSEADAFAAETRAGVNTLIGQEALEGLAAFAARREPRWDT